MIQTLPSLHFECARCGIVINHDHDKDLVTKIAAHHNAIEHRSNERLGEWAIRWPHPIVITEEAENPLLTALFDEHPRADYWLDQWQLDFSLGDSGIRPEDVLATVARFIGPELELIDQWRTP